MIWGRRIVAALLLLTGMWLLTGNPGTAEEIFSVVPGSGKAPGVTADAGDTATVIPAQGSAGVTSRKSTDPTPAGGSSAARAKQNDVTNMGRPVYAELPAQGYRSDTPMMTIGTSGVIHPPDFSHLFWIADRGVAPAADAADTAYFACHTNSKRSADEVPCNKLSGAVKRGDRLTIGLERGRLQYTVTSARAVARDQFATDQESWGVHPGRLVWVSCYLENGRRTAFNYVITAQVDARASAKRPGAGSTLSVTRLPRGFRDVALAKVRPLVMGGRRQLRRSSLEWGHGPSRGLRIVAHRSP
ncbi:sortase family protein [Nigerium massiliense]|uniref:hypothetical protein n=1 Tax=Nigerium massiliense TaxID=1522317 RepID=UPI0011C99BE9|nr:hypothetical protein [Nigerium massiliense]